MFTQIVLAAWLVSLPTLAEAPSNQDQNATTQPAAPVVVLQMRSSTRIKGTLLEETETDYRLATDDFGQISVPKEMVQAVLPADAPLGPPITPVVPPPDGLLGTSFLAGWDKSIEIGFSGKDGDTDTLDVYGKLSGDYADDVKRWRARVAYFYGTTDFEVNTKNEGFAHLRRDWLFDDSPLFLWGEGRADYNEFMAYHFRAGAFAGLGYEFYDTEKFRLLGRAGVGGSYEFGDVDDFIPEALVGLDMRWKVTEGQMLEFSTTLFPDLDNGGEYRSFTEASYAVSLQEGRGLSLKFGLQNEYDSFTEDDSKHNQLTYFGALVFNF